MLVREMERRCNHSTITIRNVTDILDNSSIEPNTKLNERDILVKTLWEHYEDSGFLSARILSYIDNGNVGFITDRNVVLNLIGSLPSKSFEILSVHDCFRCLPNYGNDLRKQYNILLSEVAKSNMLSFLISQLMNRIVPVSKLDPDLWKEILEANYSLS